MSEHYTTASFRRFVHEWLPSALGQLVDLADYRVTESGDRCAIELTVRSGKGDVTVTFEDIPLPRADGSFVIGGVERAVWLTADRSDLESAEVKCVGEQLIEEIGPRLLAPPDSADWTAELLQAWLPLDRWVREFLLNSPTSLVIDHTEYDPNWLARETCLRRVKLPEDDARPHPSHIGRVCPFETPEGPNCGRTLVLAQGAEVREGRIIATDPTPHAALGLSASMVPLLEHNDPIRQLFGVNMMRQWIDLPECEPALVRSGNEPEHGGAWIGRSLLTAFIHWKGLNYEDAIVVSESCAARLSSPEPLEIGDKLSNRHGTKGVIGAILPDDEMPHLPDGRPVDLVYDLTGLHTRRNHGQMIEAVLGHIAHATGDPVIAPPFQGPKLDDIRRMLRDAGLPEDGQTRLTDGRGGRPLDEPSTLGYVYWGKSIYRAGPKVAGWLSEGGVPRGACRQGELEFWALQACGAEENTLETFSTRSLDRPGVELLAEELARGPVTQAGPPSPAFAKLTRLLRVAGIEAVLNGERVRFGFSEPGREDVPLSAPVPHPWCPERMLTHLGPPDGDPPAYRACLRANDRLTRAPSAVRGQAEAQLVERVGRLLSRSTVREALRPGTQTLFSARAVLAPGPDLRLGEIGLPVEMAWGLFGPLVARRAGQPEAAARGPEARRALAEVMAEQVVLMNRAPTLMPTAITAFRAVLRPGPAIRLHPLCCRLFNADFDGDQAAILLPVTEAAQAEAREKLTVEGHLRRDPGSTLDHLAPAQGILFGLAWACLMPEPRKALLAGWPAELPEPPAELTRAWVMGALLELLQSAGPAVVLKVLERLAELGLEMATRSGASLHPFMGADLSLPPPPASGYPYLWSVYCETVNGAIMAQARLDSPDLGPQVILIRSGARGNVESLRHIVGPRGPLARDPFGGPVVTAGFRDGIPPEELFTAALHARSALQTMDRTMSEAGYSLRDAMLPRSDGVLARAMRSADPGAVFAEAALRGEIDPLADPMVRLFAGLRPEAAPVG